MEGFPVLILKVHRLEKHPNKALLADIHQILIYIPQKKKKKYTNIVHLCVHRRVLVSYIRTKIKIVLKKEEIFAGLHNYGGLRLELCSWVKLVLVSG